MTLAEVQRVLRHENITTTQRYLVPRLRDLVAAVQAAHDRRSVPEPPVVAGGYDSADLAVLFGSDRP